VGIFFFLSLVLASLPIPHLPFYIPKVHAEPDAVTLDAVWSKQQSPSTWIDEIAVANDATADDMTLPPMNSGTPVGDAYYLGCTTQIFDTVQINITTAGAWTSGTVRLEYSSGVSTFAYMDSTNYNAYFKSVGVQTWSFTPPDAWVLGTVNSVSAYWIRFRVTALSGFVTAPKGGQAWLTYRVTYTYEGYGVGSIYITNTGDPSIVNWNSLRIMDDLNAWGVFGYLNSAESIKDYVLRGGIDIGSGITFVPALTPLNFKLTMNNQGLNPEYYIRVLSGGTCNFGVLVSATDKTVSQGTQISILSATTTSNSFVILNEAGGNLNFYGSSLSSMGLRIQSVGTTRVWSAIVTNTNFEGEGYDFFNVIFNALGSYPFGSIYYAFSGAVDRVTVTSGTVVYLSFLVTSTMTLNNVYARGNTYVVSLYPYGVPIADVVFINPNIETWAFSWWGAYTGEVWGKYTFDLTVTYPNGTVFANANVLLSNAVEGLIYNGTTDAYGHIPQQVLTDGFYNVTGGNAIYSYNPYWLNASSPDGSYVYYKSWTVENLANWEIALLPLAEYAPVARFGFSPSNPQPSQMVSFDGSTSTDPDGSIVNYYWTFGDGYTYNGSSPTASHSYGVGIFTATLEVTDNQGAKDTFSHVIIVASTDTSTTPSPSIEIYPDYDLQILPLSDYLVHFPFFGESFQATLYLHNKGKFGKETQVTFWIEDENQQKIYEKSESLYVNRLETRDLAVDLTRPAEQGTYTLYAQITSQTRTKTVAQQSFQVYNAIGWLVGPGVIVLVIIVVLVVCAVLVLLKKYVWY
jgi:hypothetical protein